MSEAFERRDLHHWLDTPAQARHLRLVISRDDELPQIGGAGEPGDPVSGSVLPDGFSALFGSIDAPSDYAERHDDYVRERMERHHGGAE
jgi:hypothetical protein